MPAIEDLKTDDLIYLLGRKELELELSRQIIKAQGDQLQRFSQAESARAEEESVPLVKSTKK